MEVASTGGLEATIAHPMKIKELDSVGARYGSVGVLSMVAGSLQRRENYQSVSAPHVRRGHHTGSKAVLLKLCVGRLNRKT